MTLSLEIGIDVESLIAVSRAAGEVILSIYEGERCAFFSRNFKTLELIKRLILKN